MDEKLHIVQHLYGEGGDPAELQRLLEDEALRAEYEALREAKQYLDDRRPARPDPLVIDRIVAAAAAPRAGVVPGQRKDRAARPGRAARRYRLAGALSGVLALVLVVGVGLNQFFFQDGAMRASEPAAFEQEAARADAEAMATDDAPADAVEAKALAGTNKDEAVRAPAFARQGGTAAPTPQPVTENERAEATTAFRDGTTSLEEEADIADADTAGPPATETVGRALAGEVARPQGAAARRNAENVPVWDEADDELVRVHQRLDMLRARSRELIWDESAVMSLDSLPAQPSEALPGFNAAGKKKQRPRQQ